jgi:hypothetical protein
MSIIIYILLGYFLFQFVFKFVIPIVRTTRAVKKQFGAMHDRVKEFQQQHTNGFNPQQRETQKQAPSAPSKKRDDDYIEFEEVK